MSEQFDVAILGAGLFGCALACHLLGREPPIRVLMVDATSASRQPSATATSAGILSVQGWDPWDLAVVRESAQEYGRIAEEEGAELVRPIGGLRVARTEGGARWLERVAHTLRQEGVEARSISPGTLRDLVPFATLDDVRSGLFSASDAVVSAADLQGAYRRAAVRAGLVVREGTGAFPLASASNGAWRVGDEMPALADMLVIAAGAWSKAVLAGLGYALPLSPFRAQAVRLRPRPLLAPFPTLHDLDWNVYVRPATLGRLLAGDGTGTREEDPLHWERDPDTTFVDQTVDAVSGLFGQLDSVHVESAWAGLCVASPDRFPLVGRVPGAPGLYVATGFNGFGTMRAGGLARRLADAMRTNHWEALAPADPGRFRLPAADFDPRPEFPLEADDEEGVLPANSPRPEAATVPVRTRPPPSLRYRLLDRDEEVDTVRWSPLSEWFDPFLPFFAKDALRTGGRVEVAEEEGRVRGLLLSGSSEGVGSGFTRVRRIAVGYLERMEEGGLYLEEPWRTGGEVVEIFAADLRDWEPRERLRNPVRLAGPEDLPEIRTLMRAELGPGVDPWLATLPRPEETAFVCEVDGRVVGVSWLARSGSYARGHTFVVHPRFRGLGIGSDLLTARMLWLRRTGARQVVSEIYDGNVASRTAAERAGMARVGLMYHFRRPKRSYGACYVRGPPHFGQTVAVESTSVPQYRHGTLTVSRSTTCWTGG